MISARGVCVPGRLDRVDLTVQAGELRALVGPNGAGKSTLLGALAGDVRVAAGVVELDGRPLRAWEPGELARVRAVVAQHSDASFPLTVREVVALGRLPHGDERHARAAVDRALDAVGLTTLADRPIPRLSGGERQRAHVARALAQIDGVPQPVLLLDEPTAAADLAWQERLLGHLRARAEGGACVVVVLHDLNQAARWARRVTVLHRGRVLADAPPEQALDAQRLSAAWGLPLRRLDVGGHPLLVPSPEKT
jgi:iron complex transport system ATP-binding protein